MMATGRRYEGRSDWNWAKLDVVHPCQATPITTVTTPWPGRPGRKRHLVRIAAAITVVIVVTTAPTIAHCRQGTVSTMADTNEHVAASAMPQEIRHAYERLEAAGRLSGSIKGNDIHEVVARYIRNGMSVRAAEEILRQAGFEVVSPPQATGGGGSSQDEIYAKSDRILADSAFGIANEVVVILLPASGGRDAAVASMSAHIYVTSL